VIWVVVVTFEAIGIEGAFAFVTRLFLVVRGSLSCEDTGDERSGGGGWPGTKKVRLDARTDCRISQVTLHIQELLVCLSFLIV